MIVTVGGEKGGVGKTTLAVHLAYMRTIAGADPVLVDADPQGSATNFCAARDERGARPRIQSIQKLGKGLAHEIRGLADRYGDIIIDTGGRDSAELRLALLVSDLVVVPINPSAYNWWTLEKIDELVGEARLSNPDLKAEVLLNRLPGLPSLRNRKVRTAVERLHGAGFRNLSALEAVLVERTIVQDNEEFGLTAFEPSVVRDKLDALAAEELAAVYKEIYGDEYTFGPSTLVGQAVREP
ncbi:MAG: AAA family ATPase [Gammaproteobacteria bacterium]